MFEWDPNASHPCPSTLALDPRKSTSSMKQGFCRLCQQIKPLCNSHALPDSAFKLIFRNSDGKAIVAVDDARTPLHYSSDSWDTPLLCLQCERDLNERYDSYGIAVFRGKIGKSTRTDNGVCFQVVDRRRLKMFFLSILWRISISPHDCYFNIDLPHEWEDALHAALRTGKNVPSSVFHVGVYKLNDTTGPKGFTHEHLRSFVVAPFARQYTGFKSVCFLFFGFLIEIFLPAIPKEFRSRNGLLTGASPTFMAPYQEFDLVPEIMDMLVRALAKHKSGLSALAK